MIDRPTRYPHFRDIPTGEWRWPNFSPAEIACRGTGEIIAHPQGLDSLQATRDALGVPLIVNSAYRSPAHNRRVGGAKASKHMEGHAFDIACGNVHPTVLRDAAFAAGFKAAAWYPKQNFVHVDMGPPRSWGAPFPERPFAEDEDAARFPPERSKPEPKRMTAAIGTLASSAGSAGAALSVFESDIAKIAVVALVLCVAGAAFTAWRLGWLTERVR